MTRPIDRPHERARDFANAVGRRIFAARKAATLTLEQMTERTGINEGQLGRIERKGEGLSVEKLLLIAEALKRPMSFFINDPEVEVVFHQRDLPTPPAVNPWWVTNRGERKNLLLFRQLRGKERRIVVGLMEVMLVVRTQRYERLTMAITGRPAKVRNAAFPKLPQMWVRKDKGVKRVKTVPIEDLDPPKPPKPQTENPPEDPQT